MLVAPFQFALGVKVRVDPLMEVVTVFESETAVNVVVPVKVVVRAAWALLSSSMVTSATASISFTGVTVSVNVVESIAIPSEA